MATIGTLFVNIKARTDALQSGLAKARKRLRKFTGTIKKVMKKVLLLGAAFVAVGGGIFLMIKRTAEAIDQTAKMARTLGTTTEALGGMQYAARSSGVEVSSFNTALMKVTRRTAEAAKGNKTYAATFKMLGLDAKKLDKVSAHEKRFALADAMAALKTPGQQMVAAFQMGEEVLMQMVPLLSEGSSGLKRFMDRYKELGGTFTMGEAMMVERMNDAIMDLGIVFDNLWKTLTIKVAPILTSTFKGIAEFIAQSGAMERIGDSIAKGIETAIIAIAHMIDAMRLMFLEARKGMLEISQTIKKMNEMSPQGILGFLGTASVSVRQKVLPTAERKSVGSQGRLRDLSARFPAGTRGGEIGELEEQIKVLRSAIDAGDGPTVQKLLKLMEDNINGVTEDLLKLERTAEDSSQGILGKIASVLGFGGRGRDLSEGFLDNWKEATSLVETSFDKFSQGMRKWSELYEQRMVDASSFTKLLNIEINKLAESLETSEEAFKQFTLAMTEGRFKDAIAAFTAGNKLAKEEAAAAAADFEPAFKERATGGTVQTAIGAFNVAVNSEARIAKETLRKTEEVVTEEKITNTLLRQIVSRGVAFV